MSAAESSHGRCHPAQLPDSMLVLERGWLSSNNIVFFEGDAAALVDSGYVSHAELTVALLERSLAGRSLTRLINTHSHSDHIGGNAAVQARFHCHITVPQGIAATIAEWDETALMLSPLGQRAARFTHDATYADGDEFSLGELNWRALAVPGHDMDALALYNPEQRLLISGDALWQDGFGVVFAELLGNPDGLKSTRETLEMLARLPVDVVIPGHGAPFVDVPEALARAFRRLAAFEQSIDRLARHALKVMLAFFMLEQRELPRDTLPEFLAGLSFVQHVNACYLGYDNDALADWLVADLTRAGVLRVEGRLLLAA